MELVLEPAHVIDVSQLVLDSCHHSDRELLDVLKRDQRRSLLPVPLQVLIFAIVEMLKLLLIHKLFEVSDRLEGGAGWEVGKERFQTHLVDFAGVIVTEEFDSEVAEFREHLVEESGHFVVLALGRRHLVHFVLNEHFLEVLVVLQLPDDA